MAIAAWAWDMAHMRGGILYRSWPRRVPRGQKRLKGSRGCKYRYRNIKCKPRGRTSPAPHTRTRTNAALTSRPRPRPLSRWAVCA
eukprot:scaffold12360_cov109-Isochrysis_galbana.AAC.6